MLIHYREAEKGEIKLKQNSIEANGTHENRGKQTEHTEQVEGILLGCSKDKGGRETKKSQY